MAQTDTANYKNVKKVAKAIPEKGSKMMNSRTSGFSLENLFNGKIEEFLTDNTQALIQRYGGNMSDLKATAKRYARDFPVATVIGAAAVGLAVGLIAVNAWSSTHSGSRR